MRIELGTLVSQNGRAIPFPFHSKIFWSRKVQGKGYLKLTCKSTTLLPEARVGGHGYSSPFVCLFVYFESTHLDVTALRLRHG